MGSDSIEIRVLAQAIAESLLSIESDAIDRVIDLESISEKTIIDIQKNCFTVLNVKSKVLPIARPLPVLPQTMKTLENN